MVLQRNPYLAIWFKPRATMRAILDGDPGRMVLILSMLWGVSDALGRAMWKDFGDRFTMPLIVALAGILGPSGGLMVLYVMGLYLARVGRLLGGQGRAHELRAAFAWSSIPAVAGLLLLFPAILFFGDDLFTSDIPRIESQPILFFSFIVYLLAARHQVRAEEMQAFLDSADPSFANPYTGESMQWNGEEKCLCFESVAPGGEGRMVELYL